MRVPFRARVRRYRADIAYSFYRRGRRDGGLLLAGGGLRRIRRPGYRQFRARDPCQRIWVDHGLGHRRSARPRKGTRCRRPANRGQDVALWSQQRRPAIGRCRRPIWIDDQARIAHDKAMVIDEAIVLTSSYNWTRAAAEYSEDINFVSSPIIASRISRTGTVGLLFRSKSTGATTGAGFRRRRRGDAGAIIRFRARPAQRDPRRTRELSREPSDLARVLRGRRRERTAEAPFGWRRISQSGEVTVDPRRGVRCAIRDTVPSVSSDTCGR